MSTASTSTQDSATAFANKLIALKEQESKLARQFENTLHEVNSFAEQDPHIWSKVTEILKSGTTQAFDSPEGVRRSLNNGATAAWSQPDWTPLDKDILDLGGQPPGDVFDFGAGPFLESPPFGPTSDLDFATSAIPPLSLDGTFDVSTHYAFSEPASYARSNTTSSTSSGPSPTLSPYLSPFAFAELSTSADVLASPFSSPFSSHAFPISADGLSLDPLCADFSLPGAFAAHDIAVGSPASLFPEARSSSLDETFQQLLSGSTGSSASVTRSNSRSTKPRRGSSGSTSLRFNPMAPMSPIAGSSTTRASAPIPMSWSASTGMSSISSSLAALTTSPSATIARSEGSLSRKASSSKKQRIPRMLVYDESKPVEKNSVHLFAVHTQSKCKAEITENSITPLILDDATTSPTSPLALAVQSPEQSYTPAMFRQDCAHRTNYLFYSPTGQSFTVTFNQFGSTIRPTFTPNASHAQTCHPASSPSPIYTFIHMHPGDIVTSPSYPLGSREWWRQQNCQQQHPGMPGDGTWTCRYDGEGGEKRRPTRVVKHFADCGAGKVEWQGQAWSLQKLAKAVLAVLPGHAPN